MRQGWSGNVLIHLKAFWPIHTANLNAIKALGRSDLFLKLEIIKNHRDPCARFDNENKCYGNGL